MATGGGKLLEIWNHIRERYKFSEEDYSLLEQALGKHQQVRQRSDSDSDLDSLTKKFKELAGPSVEELRTGRGERATFYHLLDT